MSSGKITTEDAGREQEGRAAGSQHERDRRGLWKRQRACGAVRQGAGGSSAAACAGSAQPAADHQEREQRRQTTAEIT